MYIYKLYIYIYKYMYMYKGIGKDGPKYTTI